MLRDEDSQGEDSWGEGCSRLRMLRDEDAPVGMSPLPNNIKQKIKPWITGSCPPRPQFPLDCSG